MIPRNISAAVDGVMSSGRIPILALVELQFASSTARFCNTNYDFAWAGYTWTGCGCLGKISELAEGKDLQMYGCTLEISGIPSEFIAEALGEEYQGRSATIWLAVLDSDYTVLADPIIVFRGLMDTMPIRIGTTATIQITVESPLIDWERPRLLRFNDEDQQRLYPGDKGFEYVAQMVEATIIWGQ